MESWQRKTRRAQKHFQEVHRAVRSYVRRDVYRAVQTAPSNRYPTRWRFVLEFTEQPDPEIAIPLGDFMFNLRSALDHVACAAVPANRKHQAGFPIVAEQIFAKATDGQWKLPRAGEQREAFNRQVAGMHPDAIAFIKSRQPYNREGPGVTGLQALSALQNADKHRSLTVLAVGIIAPSVRITWPGGEHRFALAAHAEANTPVATYRDILPDRIDYRDVEVEISGTPDVSAVVGGPQGEQYGLIPLCAVMCEAVCDDVIPAMERFAI